MRDLTDLRAAVVGTGFIGVVGSSLVWAGAKSGPVD